MEKKVTEHQELRELLNELKTCHQTIVPEREQALLSLIQPNPMINPTSDLMLSKSTNSSSLIEKESRRDLKSLPQLHNFSMEMKDSLKRKDREPLTCTWEKSK